MSGGDRKAPVTVCCAANDRFVIPLAVTVLSILETLDDRKLVLYLIDGGIEEESYAKLLQSWDTDRLEIHRIEPDPEVVKDLPLWGRMSIETYYRLAMPDLLPASLEKVIWLDCDTVARRSLTELWDADLGENAILAVQDLVVPYVSSRYGVAPYRDLGLNEHDKHFNAGVMVVNLKWWREQHVLDTALEYLRRHHSTAWFWDQEGLNVALHARWGELDHRWNQIASVCGRAFFKPRHLDDTTYRRLVEDPYIVHYAGTLKPWKNISPSRGGRLFSSWVDRTAWRGWRPRLELSTFLQSLWDSPLRNLTHRLEHPIMQLQRARSWKT